MHLREVSEAAQTTFPVPHASGSHFVSASPEEHKKVGFQRATTSGAIPVFSVRGLTVASRSRVSPRSLKDFHAFSK